MAKFEEEVRIRLTCCGKGMVNRGNLSLRGPSDRTRLGYECSKCFRRVMVTDEWDSSTPEVNALHDIEE